MSLEPGAERIDEFTVEDRLVTDVGGTIGVRVLSTPGMIAMMERCASLLSFENLPEGQATVGFEVCVKHVAAAAEGQPCRVRATLREIADERKLRFDVEVTEGERTIGVGELRDHVRAHERGQLDPAQPRGAQHPDQPHLLGRRDHLGLVLEPVARPDLADPDALRQLAHAAEVMRPATAHRPARPPANSSGWR